MARTFRHLPVALISAAAALLLASCGGSDAGPAAPAVAGYYAQAVAWQRCDPSVTDQPAAAAYLAAQGDRVQCAVIRAPRDWSEPTGGDVSLAMMRMAASDPSQRRASLLVNPGGPGIDGLLNGLSLYRALNNSNPDDAVGALQLQVLARYDLVGFSPRGVGASTRLGCASTERARYVELSPSLNALTDATLDDALYNLQKQSEACAANPLTPHINTDATARDLDLMRHLLGDEKLHYLGYSYGTWLGAWYAALFPDKVGRMVLDGVVDFTAPLDALGATQTTSRQRLQDEVLLPYAARHPDVAQLGSDPAAIGRIAQGLDPQLEVALGSRLSNLSYRADDSEEYVATWLAAHTLQGWFERPLPRDTRPQWERYAQRASEHRFSPDNTMNELARGQSIALLQTMNKLHPQNPQPAAEPPDATGMAVRCNDAPGVTDRAAWKDGVRSMAQQAPLHYMITEMLRCLHWGGPSVNQPGLERLKPLDLLLVQAEYDSATATPGALHFFSQLDNARMVYVPGEHQHAVFPYATGTRDDRVKCVNRSVARYLLGDSPTERTTLCAAEPKQWDAPATKSHTDGSATAAFLHPEDTARLMKNFRRGITPQPPTERAPGAPDAPIPTQF